MRKLFYSVIGCLMLFGAADAAPKGQSVIKTTGTVSKKVTSSTLYSEECYNSYFGCMNEFCRSENDSGASCVCSDDHKKYEKDLAEIETMLTNANMLTSIEIEKIELGAKTDIVFSGGRKYDELGNVIVELSEDDKKKEKKTNRRANLLSMLEDIEEIDGPFTTHVENISSYTGAQLYSNAHELCMETMPETCSREMTILTQLYSTQIKNDCRALELSVKNTRTAAEQALADAQKDVRDARLKSFESSNAYDRGGCMVAFKECMMEDKACGSDWSRCVSTVASENMQNNAAISTKGTKVAVVTTHNIAESTLEMLESKKFICESILDQCVAVRDYVWPDFLREAALDIKTAERNAESKFRQSCLGTISNCIQKACKDDIVGSGEATMDACLARPDMARSFCKNEIDPCERMEPQIWSYVKDKLAAMRVDRCTEEVKECFYSEDRCGSDFMNCIGIDYDTLHDMCPVDKLVVCKQDKADFSLADVDRMLMGFYLNVDNAALDNCQNLVEAKMDEICGSTTDCNKFAADDVIGTGSLNYQKTGNVYSITGMMSFGQIKVGNTKEDAGKIDVTDYVAKLSAMGVSSEHVHVADNVVYELENIQGTINRVIDLIEQDPKISFCIHGRDLSQITGTDEKGNGKFSKARYPNLLTQQKMLIATSALRVAQDNYNKKYTEFLAKASKESSADMANLMCNKLPFENGQAQGISAIDLDDSGISKPFALVLEIAGVSNASMAAGGTRTSKNLGGAKMETASGNAAGGSDGGAVSTVAATLGGATVATKGIFTAMGGTVSSLAGTAIKMNPAGLIADSAVKAIGILASDKHKVEFEGGTREMWSIFNRETRVCHYCTSTITKDCKTKGSRGFLGLWDSRGMECKESPPVEECRDIPM